MSPSSLSDALTPLFASNLSPTFNSKSFAIISGALLIIDNFGFTVTFISFLTVFPSLSVTSYTTLYIPAFDVFTVFSATFILLVISPSSLSDALTPDIALNTSSTFNTTSFALISGILFI